MQIWNYDFGSANANLKMQSANSKLELVKVIYDLVIAAITGVVTNCLNNIYNLYNLNNCDNIVFISFIYYYNNIYLISFIFFLLYYIFTY
jgi:hypothetical protein